MNPKYLETAPYNTNTNTNTKHITKSENRHPQVQEIPAPFNNPEYPGTGGPDVVRIIEKNPNPLEMGKIYIKEKVKILGKLVKITALSSSALFAIAGCATESNGESKVRPGAIAGIPSSGYTTRQQRAPSKPDTTCYRFNPDCDLTIPDSEYYRDQPKSYRKTQYRQKEEEEKGTNDAEDIEINYDPLSEIELFRNNIPQLRIYLYQKWGISVQIQDGNSKEQVNTSIINIMPL